MSDGIKLETMGKKITVKLVDGTIIRGLVNLNSDTMPVDRVSDLLTKGQYPFIVVYGTTVGGKKDQVFIINKTQILWAAPAEDEGNFVF
ncbi:hypothetical protein ACUUL3_06940 [Thiovibrio sp. JS02]